MLSLSPTEKEIMEVLWKSEGMTNNEIILYFKERGREWKRQTTNTFLTRLADKGLVTKTGHKYKAAYTKQEFETLRRATFRLPTGHLSERLSFSYPRKIFLR